ncbi:caspase-8-like [Triplophysa dalaica]|uniref:caspase-8-like n=1 Tax=Triplophysa dalaica TaxID=1582913 RepID=UPI0024DFECED|nr:caspase-8-like [Triplophysa dalaica]
MSERIGSDEDQKSLDRVFSWLGFTVLVHKDKTAAQMKDLLKDLGRTVNGDCFVCCILSHGSSDGVYGTDGNIVSVDEIRDPFNGSNCRNLAGKPKLFFIQACRGKKYQNVVQVQADDPEGDESELEVDADRMEVLIPADSDFLIARSTIDHYYSFRNIMKGSWFIQSLCKQLETLCPQGTDIQTILLAVNYDVSLEGVTRKQMSVHEVAMRMKLILHVPKVQQSKQEPFKKSIRQNKRFLIDTLQEDADFILQHVQQDELITDREYRLLKDDQQRKGREDVVITLLDKLMGKGEETCKKFIKLLERDELLETFPNVKNHSILATDNPVTDNSKLSIDLQKNLQKLACSSEKFKKGHRNQEQGHEDDYYPVTQRPLGYCLIFNNLNYHQLGLSNRTGTDKDRDDLTRLFLKMHFWVEVRNDLQGPDMLNVIKEFAEKDHSRMDVFVCCILSHGAIGTVMGTDGQCILIRDLILPFAESRTLANKPKLFFIQASQGTNRNIGVFLKNIQETNKNDAQMDVSSIPLEADFLIGMSTAAHCVSVRNIVEGSIYIQELCKQLEECCSRKEDILSILTKVNRKVSTTNLMGHKQIPEPRYTLTRKLVLPWTEALDH